MFPSKIFKAYDIRGIYPSELNEDLAYKIGRAFGALRQKELGRTKDIKIAVGHDMRLSSPSLVGAVKKGLLEQGIDVIDVGLTSTPTLYFAVAFYNYDGGLLVTASHNPKEYNGIKLLRERALPVGLGIGMEEVRDLAEKGEFTEPEKNGEVSIKEGMIDEQVKFEETYAHISKIKKFKIVLDTANSMGIVYLNRLFQDLPQVELVKINEELDGNFPAHQPDPFQEKNAADLKKRVVEERADLGIATDGDGDRIFFIDNLGQMVEPPIVRGIMAKLFLRDNPGAVICYDIRPGKITEDMILENGGIPSVAKVGHSFIKKQMIETGAVFGGESSGHFFVKFPQGTYEAPMVVVLKFLQELSETGLSLADYCKPLRRYFGSGEINFEVEDKERVFALLREKFADAKINEMDGLTFTYPDFWFNMRASNTEPLVRLNLEAFTAETRDAKVKEIKNLLEL